MRVKKEVAQPPPNPSPISVVTLDTSSQPVAEQFDYWAKHSPLTRLSPIRSGGFFASGSFWTMGPIAIARCTLDPFVSKRDRQMLVEAPGDHILLVALSSGEVVLDDDAGITSFAAPNAFLRDYAIPSNTTSNRIECITAYFPRDYLEEKIGPQHWQGAAKDRSAARLAISTLATLTELLGEMNEGSGSLFARLLRDMVAAAWAFKPTARPADTLPDRMPAIRAYMFAQSPGTVTVEGMARALGISRSALYRMFEPFGGVIAYDRRRRLQMVYRSLADPDDHRTIADIGLDHGFPDKSQLTRVFRREFGCPPRDLRQRLHDIDTIRDDTPAAIIRDAVSRLQR